MSSLVNLKEWCEENKKPGQRFRSDHERKQFAKDRGVKVVTNPKDNCLCVPVYEKTLMLQGSRHSVRKEKEQEYEDRGAAKESFEKQRASLEQVQTNSKVCGAHAVGSHGNNRVHKLFPKKGTAITNSN